MKTNSVKILSASLLGLFIQAAYAGNITDVKVSVLPNQQRVVKLKFDHNPVQPSGFVTSSPARIALDFPNTSAKVSRSNLTFNDKLLNQVTVGQDNTNTRVSLNLATDGQYNAEIKGNEVWVYVSAAQSVNTAGRVAGSTSSANAVSSRTSDAVPFSIDFHTGANKSGVIEFSSNYAEQPQIKRQNDRLIITLKNYPLPTQAQRNLDVTDFSTPVRIVSARRLGNDTQIVIRNQGAWDYKLSGGNGSRNIQIIPTKNVADSGLSTTRSRQKFSGKRISLDFQDVEVRTILQILANESGMNIVASDSVQGKMSLSLKDVPWDQALDLVLDARNLDMRKVGNIINIAPRAELLAKDKADLTARKEIEELGPLLTQSFQLKYKNVEEFKKILKFSDTGSSSSSSNSILTSRGSALIDPSTNTLIITDTRTVIQKFEKLIDELDVPSRQVMVEARIVEASDGFSRELGVTFTGNAVRNDKSGSGTNTWSANASLPISTTATGNIGLVRAVASGALGLTLSAAESDNRSKTISSPRVLTQDRQEAEIKQGVQIPYTTRDSDGAYTTSFKDAVLDLKVTPRITPDNKVIMDITINKDEPDYSHVSVEGEPGIATKYVKTQAMVEDGGTLIVGGIYQEQMSNSLKKVPYLADIPVLGNLFKSRSRSTSRNELLFFITPRIMGGETSTLRY